MLVACGLAIANHDVASPLVEVDAPAAFAAPPQTSGAIGEPTRAKVREEDVERAMARFTRLQSEQQSAKKSQEVAGDELSTAKGLPAEAERELAVRSALFRGLSCNVVLFCVHVKGYALWRSF